MIMFRRKVNVQIETANFNTLVPGKVKKNLLLDITILILKSVRSSNPQRNHLTF